MSQQCTSSGEVGGEGGKDSGERKIRMRCASAARIIHDVEVGMLPAVRKMGTPRLAEAGLVRDPIHTSPLRQDGGCSMAVVY